MGDVTQVKRLAKRLAKEMMKKANASSTQAHQAFCLAKLQPWPDNVMDHVDALNKRDKARRLRRIALQFERIGQKGTGLGSHPRPAVMFRSKAAQ